MAEEPLGEEALTRAKLAGLKALCREHRLPVLAGPGRGHEGETLRECSMTFRIQF